MKMSGAYLDPPLRGRVLVFGFGFNLKDYTDLKA